MNPAAGLVLVRKLRDPTQQGGADAFGLVGRQDGDSHTEEGRKRRDVKPVSHFDEMVRGEGSELIDLGERGVGLDGNGSVERYGRRRLRLTPGFSIADPYATASVTEG